MRKQTHFAATLFLFVAFFNTNLPDHVSLYIGTYKDIAIEEMNRSGIPASIILAQGIHESAWGRGKLAVKSNNHFGIKCKDYWTGKKYYHKDDDYDEQGNLLKSCFRAYEKSLDSYLDHTDFLVSSPRYKNLFNYSHTDYNNWAKGLKKCGYATDPEYAEKLIRTIEKYGLDKYDRQLETALLTVAPPQNTSSQNINIHNLFVQEESPQTEQAFIESTEYYEIPAAVEIPEDYQRIDFKDLFNEEPVVQEAVPVIPTDYTEDQQFEVVEEEVLPETKEEFIAETQMVHSETIITRPPLRPAGQVAPVELNKVQPQTNLDQESIIPARRNRMQRNTQLSRKPRTRHNGLR